MNSITLENMNEARKIFAGYPCVMYGAGSNGQRLLKVFRENDIRTDYFCDDDFNKWGTNFCGLPVMSFEDLEKLSRDGRVNVVLTSVFAGPILGRLEKLGNVEVYEAFSILIDRYYPKSFYNVPLTSEEIRDISGKISLVEERIRDKESTDILERIRYTIEHPDERDYKRFFPAASREDCYFVHEVLEALPENSVIVDCGGFTGDLMVGLEKHNISYSKVYSFEVNADLFREMQDNIAKNGLQGKFIPVNKGVWDKTGYSYLNVDENDIAGGNIRDSKEYGIKIETVAMDDFFKDIPFDFVKMDIEGAELRALHGGGGGLSKYRPILAICLYHSVYDVVNIPLYLLDMLKDYRFIIRHHSFIGTETVLYGIPEGR